MSTKNISEMVNRKMVYCGIFVIITLMIILISSVGEVNAQSNIKAINYKVSGNGRGLKSLKLEPIFSLDDINDIRLGLLYDGYSFNFDGSWLVNFRDEKNYKMNLVIQLGLGIADTSSFRNALGLAGEGYYLTNNRYFWETKYLTRRQKWILQGGIALPVSASTDLTLAAGNSIWYPESYLLHLGFAVDL